MINSCENLKKCGFFLNYQGNNEVIKKNWVFLFCKDTNRSERCERKKIKKQTGQAPPDNMSPTGKILRA